MFSVKSAPSYETSCKFKENLRVTWFSRNVSQSALIYPRQSNACTVIAILIAIRCHNCKINVKGPEIPPNPRLIVALQYAIFMGNKIHDHIMSLGNLNHTRLTVPEAMQYSGASANYMCEWKNRLHLTSLQTTLYTNLKRGWRKWLQFCNQNNIQTNLYIILISDGRSVLFMVQNQHDTVTLMDSHEHSQTRGASICTVKRPRLQILCRWYIDLINRCYNSNPNMYELSYLYFEQPQMIENAVVVA